MKTKSIVYNSFVPNAEIKPAISQSNIPSFKYTGYKPRYKWSNDDSSNETTIQTPVVQSTSEIKTEDQTESVIEWQDPASIDWSKIADYENTPTITQSQSTTRQRGQHIFKDPSIQVGEMQGLLDAFADAGISLRITSGTRPGATTKQGNQSWHSQGRALDITPVAGQTFEDLKRQIRNAPELINYMRSHGYGIFDETSSATQQQTGATGSHWHIGPDKTAITGLETILKGRKGLKIPILFKKNGNKY